MSFCQVGNSNREFSLVRHWCVIGKHFRFEKTRTGGMIFENEKREMYPITWLLMCDQTKILCVPVPTRQDKSKETVQINETDPGPTQ